MLWKYFLISLLATVKFIFSPLAALSIEGHTWFYTYTSVASGGLLSATVFYFLSLSIINKNVERRIKKGIIKKKFTRMNKIIILTKKKVGVIGLALLTASFISIPLGSIVTAKFYRHKKSTIFYIYGAILLSAGIFTGITYYLMT